MAFTGTLFNWVSVPPGVWTEIWQGPLIQGFPLQFLEIGLLGSWTLEGFSAAPPFYQFSAGTGAAPLVTNLPIFWAGTAALVLSFRSSPWVQFNILTNRRCFAHIAAV